MVKCCFSQVSSIEPRMFPTATFTSRGARLNSRMLASMLLAMSGVRMKPGLRLVTWMFQP